MLAMESLRIAYPLDISVTENGAEDMRLCGLKLVKQPPRLDFSCSGLVLPSGSEFQLIDDDGFSQWIYLACPASFQMAVPNKRGVSFAPDYILESRAVCLGRDIAWFITVNFLQAMCNAGGVCMTVRKFHLKFSCFVP